MTYGGWHINLSGADIKVYDTSNHSKEIGKITKNECFIYGCIGASTSWDGEWGEPVTFLDASHNLTVGVVASLPSGVVEFTKYASNGTSWISTSSMVRKVQSASKIYDRNGNKVINIPAGSYVSLDPANACGKNNNDFISIYSYTINGTTKTFQNSNGKQVNGFIDLIPGNNWLNAGNVILRKA